METFVTPLYGVSAALGVALRGLARRCSSGSSYYHPARVLALLRLGLGPDSDR